MGGNRYPAGEGRLQARLAARHQLSEEMVRVSGGSLTLLRDLLTAFCGQGREGVIGWRSYEAYPIIIGSTGARAVRVPLHQDRLDPEGPAAAVSPRTSVVLASNPNNPTGTALSEPEVLQLAEAVPERCLLVLDQAYCEFSPPELGELGLRLVRERANVVVLRSFSKAFALAGLRVGWCAADRAVLEALERVSLPFTLTELAEAAALASLELEPRLRHRVRVTVSERERLVGELRQSGWEVPDSGGNFFWLPLADRSLSLAQACAAQGISVHCFPGEGVRVTVGTPEENRELLMVVSSWRAGGARL